MREIVNSGSVRAMYLIDANNLIGHTKSISYKDPQARQQVLDRIAKFLESRHRKATVIFDGTAEPLRKTRWMQLVFSGPGRTADDLIRTTSGGYAISKGFMRRLFRQWRVRLREKLWRGGAEVS